MYSILAGPAGVGPNGIATLTQAAHIAYYKTLHGKLVLS